MTTPTVAAPLGYDVHRGFRIDGTVVIFWSLKRDARSAAEAIGWPANSIERVHTRFCNGYALKQTHGGFLTREAYAALLPGCP